MNKNIFKALIFSICTIFLLTISITGFILYNDYKIGIQASEIKIQKLVEKTNESIAKNQYPNKEFIKDFTNAIGALDQYKLINLKSTEQNIYDYNSNTNQLTNLFTITKSTIITDSPKLSLTLTVSIYTVLPTSVFSKIKIAFLIILATTFLSALMLIYLYLSNENYNDIVSKSKNTASQDNSINDELDLNFNEDSNFLYENSNEPNNIYELNTTDNNFLDENSLDYNIEEDNYKSNNTNLSDETSLDYDMNYSEYDSPSDFKSDEIETISDALNFDYDSFSEESNVSEFIEDTPNDGSQIVEYKEDIIDNSSTDDTTEQVSEYFDNETGLCKNELLITRLESELARASSSELELSIILIQIPDIKLSNECGIQICKNVLDIFHYRDMIFEYKNDGIAIIYSNANIDKSIETSEQIYAEICTTLAKYDINSKPIFGIASRSLRFISGERLIVEAEQALLHAKEDVDSPIIAFRVNPEKYRKFMAMKNR